MAPPHRRQISTTCSALVGLLLLTGLAACHPFEDAEQYPFPTDADLFPTTDTATGDVAVEPDVPLPEDTSGWVDGSAGDATLVDADRVDAVGVDASVEDLSGDTVEPVRTLEIVPTFEVFDVGERHEVTAVATGFEPIAFTWSGVGYAELDGSAGAIARVTAPLEIGATVTLELVACDAADTCEEAIATFHTGLRTFVANQVVSVEPDGSPSAPWPTIGEALQVVQDAKDRGAYGPMEIKVAGGGTYPEVVEIGVKVNMTGGWDPETWESAAAMERPIIKGAVLLFEAQASISHMNIHAPLDPGPSQRVFNSNGTLHLADVNIKQSDGATQQAMGNPGAVIQSNGVGLLSLERVELVWLVPPMAAQTWGVSGTSKMLFADTAIHVISAVGGREAIAVMCQSCDLTAINSSFVASGGSAAIGVRLVGNCSARIDSSEINVAGSELACSNAANKCTGIEASLEYPLGLARPLAPLASGTCCDPEYFDVVVRDSKIYGGNASKSTAYVSMSTMYSPGACFDRAVVWGGVGNEAMGLVHHSGRLHVYNSLVHAGSTGNSAGTVTKTVGVILQAGVLANNFIDGGGSDTTTFESPHVAIEAAGPVAINNNVLRARGVGANSTVSLLTMPGMMRNNVLDTGGNLLVLYSQPYTEALIADLGTMFSNNVSGSCGIITPGSSAYTTNSTDCIDKGIDLNAQCDGFCLTPFNSKNGALRTGVPLDVNTCDATMAGATDIGPLEQ